MPLRDSNGERAYPTDQVEKLRIIKRLLDRGHRPGKVIERPLDELLALGAQPSVNDAPRQDIEVFLRLIKSHQLPELRRQLSQALARQGLQGFVMDTVAPLNVAVGDAWMRGFLAVFEEHIYTELMQSILRNAVGALQGQDRTPRVLLTSLPNELHNLGLLMVEAILSVEGATCIPLGTETPLAEIVGAAQAQRADIVALSFSAAYSETKAAEGLKELRALLPGPMLLCAGGSAVQRIRKPIEGVRLVTTLDEMVQLIKDWRAQRFVY
jgi:MerR family transcriptional regulator, light-induced transcriptional regulator